ncbi:methyltransferase domain-containing protein [Phytoactinopolyspora alkaliphila]|uniref:Methyltransferase domain-containing protein n=1 Tax=Phytoactinopolyspora alkaliphila TaxID=1783498 RepID=A0A6N9YFW9_9ACTN|nr:methyltransferase domain-containing protein [Phytoactinopolyspora alkaliphila]NED93805.1 methyltransferase domain-containing protein [Phytoactinopolyspora alkaliphila]
MADMVDQSRRGVRMAEVWDQVLSAMAVHASETGPASLDVVDVGGGSGTFAVPLAARGHRVIVVDPSPNALATLRQRAAESGVTELITAVQGEAADVRSLVGPHAADVVLCHGVLDVVDDPAAALAGMVPALRPHAMVSVVVAQRNAAVLGKAMAGHFRDALHMLEDRDGRWGSTDPLPRRFSEGMLTDLLGAAGLSGLRVFGVRFFTDLVPGALVDDPADVRELAALESRAATMADMRPLAAALHVIGWSGTGE